MDQEVKRGDIWYAHLSPVVGSEQGGDRPVVVVQNDVGNRFSPTVIVAPVTTQTQKKQFPTHVPITKSVTGIPKNSVILLEQLRTIDKRRLMDKLNHLDEVMMAQVDHMLKVSLGLVD